MQVDGTTKQGYYANAQGSISAVADNSGNVLEQYEYDPQGHVQIANGSGTTRIGTQIGNNILYTGRSYDFETGNYFYRARYYSPDLGRFISRDPLSGAEFSQGTNLYAYCRNNFLNASDPTGMCKFNLNPNSGLGSGLDSIFKNNINQADISNIKTVTTSDLSGGGADLFSSSPNVTTSTTYSGSYQVDEGTYPGGAVDIETVSWSETDVTSSDNSGPQPISSDHVSESPDIGADLAADFKQVTDAISDASDNPGAEASKSYIETMDRVNEMNRNAVYGQ